MTITTAHLKFKEEFRLPAKPPPRRNEWRVKEACGSRRDALLRRPRSDREGGSVSSLTPRTAGKPEVLIPIKSPNTQPTPSTWRQHTVTIAVGCECACSTARPNRPSPISGRRANRKASARPSTTWLFEHERSDLGSAKSLAVRFSSAPLADGSTPLWNARSQRWRSLPCLPQLMPSTALFLP